MSELIKLSDTHYVVVDDSEIKVGDWVIDKHKNIYQQVTDKIFEQFTGARKITHSTELLESIYNAEAHEVEDGTFRKIKPLSLSEVEEVIYGYSIEEMADEWSVDINNVHPADSYIAKEGYLAGFKAHQKLVKDKNKEVIELLKNITEWSSFKEHPIGKQAQRCLNILLPKTEWDIEIINSKIKLI